MKLNKALRNLGLARSGAEADRLIKQGAVWAGGCIPPCNGRLPPYECICGGWRKITNPTEEVSAGEVVRIGSGNWRLLQKEGSTGFDQLPGIGWVPDANT